MNELLSYVFSPLREGDISLYRGSGNGLAPILLVAAEETSLGCIERLEHEYALKCELDADWAARPIALTHYKERMTLVLEDPGGAPVDRLLGRPLDVSHFLRIAIPLAGALRRVHERGLIHKDIKPANILVDATSGGVWLTGFGIASRLPRERQAPAPPEVIAGTLAYTQRCRYWIKRLPRKKDQQCPPDWPALTKSGLSSHPARYWSGSGIDSRSG